MHMASENPEYLFYMDNNGSGGAAENPNEDDSEEEICVMNACSCKICFNYYTDIMFKQRKTDSERLVEELQTFSTTEAVEETRSADFNQEELVLPESDCESLVNHFVNLKISSPKITMISRSEIVIDQNQLQNDREQPYMLADHKYENQREYSEDEQNSVRDREIIRNQFICYDFGELDEYLRNHEQLLALKSTVGTFLQSLDSENHIDKPDFGTTFSTSALGYCNWYSWQGFEWNECFDFTAPSSYRNFRERELSQCFNESSSEIVYSCDEYNEHCDQTELATSRWTNNYDLGCYNTSHKFEEEWDKIQYFLSAAQDNPLTESSIWSVSLDFLDTTVSDEQYQADISSNFDEAYENDDAISDNTSCDSHDKTKTSTGFPRDVLFFDEFSGLNKYRKRLGVKQRRIAASYKKNINSREWSSSSTYSDSDNSDMQRPFRMHEQKEPWKDKFHFEEVKAFYNFESSLSHNQIWTICYDLGCYQISRKWKRSLQQTRKGAREQIRQYFDELKSKISTEFNLSTVIPNNCQTLYDFLDYDCTWVYDDQHQADLSTSSDETLTRISTCSDSDDQAYNTTPEGFVKPRRTKIPYGKARSRSKARRGNQVVECAQFKHLDSDESFEVCGGSKPIWCA